MGFSEKIKTRAMVACGRKCCICHKYCGNKIEVHHIKPRAEGGKDIFENAIPLCFDCHAEVKHYNPNHPKGIKFTEKELIEHRDNWYQKIQHDLNGNREEKNKRPDESFHPNNYQRMMLKRICKGKELLLYLSGTVAISYDEECRSLEEMKIVGDFIQYVKELIDFDDILEEPSDRLMVAFNLTQSIEELDQKGFWVFVGRENRKLFEGENETMNMPVFLMRIVRKDSKEIILNSLQ